MDEFTKFRASLASSIMTEKPDVSWDDVAGLHAAKEMLKEAVILPLKFPQVERGSLAILLYLSDCSGEKLITWRTRCSRERESRGRVFCCMGLPGPVSPTSPKQSLLRYGSKMSRQ